MAGLEGVVEEAEPPVTLYIDDLRLTIEGEEERAPETEMGSEAREAIERLTK